MKLHAAALCLASVVAAGAASADTTYRESYQRTEIYPYYREVIYPDLPSPAEIAAKVSRINEDNRREAAELRAIAGTARTAGWNNVATVYDVMASDHDKGAQVCAEWLTSYDFRVPAEPTVTLAADMTPETSIEHMVDMHMKMFNDSLAQREGEKSFTVRGLLLMNAATAQRHIALLHALDRDMDLGRHNLSAYLQGLLEMPLTASAQETWITETITEETEYWAAMAPVQQPYTVATNDTEIETTITETTPTPTPAPVAEAAPAPAPAERVVEKPVYVERIVEKPVYIQRAAPVRSQVAGRRQTSRARTMRARRAAH